MGAGTVVAVRARHEPRDAAFTAAARRLGIDVRAIEVSDLLASDRELPDHVLAALVGDPLLVDVTPAAPAPEAIDVFLLPGVTDRVADEAATVAAELGTPARFASGRRFVVRGELDAGERERLAARLLANPVIERWDGRPGFTAVGHPAAGDGAAVEVVAVRDLDDAGLAALDAERRLALDAAELAEVRRAFTAEGRDPTDAELETVAQTWSEHCSHKTFRATLVDASGGTRPPLLDRLRRTTEAIGAGFVVSAFAGNAGIVRFRPDAPLLAIKAETHNHPSAIEPFGGANTGVGGVVRDVVGVAATPVAAYDVLCFGPADLDPAEVPAGSIHPALVHDGVVAGVADYGNKIGVPTVAGAVLYDRGYVANPLVFCGAVGVVPDGLVLDGPHPGDRIVVVGGRTGRDGIKGATFSSATMDATTGDVAGASVQIGDPIVEKLVIDLVAEAAPLGVFSAITDCGAGGLSSAIGELGERTGAEVVLDDLPLKYPGLAPWERWLSEAQERMVLAVPPDRLPTLRTLARRHGVELCDVGSFGGGRLVVRCGAATLVDLDPSWLHGGRPARTMPVVAPTPDRTGDDRRIVANPTSVLLALLAHPNLASKQAVVRRYDHEVQGATVVRPSTGALDDGPSDGVVLARPDEQHGFAIGIGVNPRYGELDPERMAWACVDEAIRNVVAAGADPALVALLDNVSWGDPRRPETLGALEAAVDGCCAAARAFGAPFVSGKDSLNNEYLAADGTRHAVPPTLVVTALAHVPDADRTVTTDLLAPGDRLMLLGRTLAEFGGSHLDLVSTGGASDGAGGGSHDTAAGATVPAPDPDAPARYRALHRLILDGVVRSCHDVSEGGLAVTLAEMAIGGRLGVDVDPVALSAVHPDPVVALFSESLGRHVVAVAEADVATVRRSVPTAVVLGTVRAGNRFTVGPVDTTVEALAEAFLR